MDDLQTLIAVISQQRNQALDALARAQADVIKLTNEIEKEKKEVKGDGRPV